jgi:hypothetical protein
MERQYDPMQVSAHKEAVSLFERYAKGGDDPKLKDWAKQNIASPAASSGNGPGYGQEPQVVRRQQTAWWYRDACNRGSRCRRAPSSSAGPVVYGPALGSASFHRRTELRHAPAGQEAGNVAHLCREGRVVRELECADAVWLKPVRAPDTLDVGQAHARDFRHCAAGPRGRFRAAVRRASEPRSARPPPDPRGSCGSAWP